MQFIISVFILIFSITTNVHSFEEIEGYVPGIGDYVPEVGNLVVDIEGYVPKKGDYVQIDERDELGRLVKTYIIPFEEFYPELFGVAGMFDEFKIDNSQKMKFSV